MGNRSVLFSEGGTRLRVLERSPRQFTGDVHRVAVDDSFQNDVDQYGGVWTDDFLEELGVWFDVGGVVVGESAVRIGGDLKS